MWSAFSKSHCNSLFSNPNVMSVVDLEGRSLYSITNLKSKFASTNFYDTRNEAIANLKLGEVTKQQVNAGLRNTTLRDYLRGSNAVTSPNFGLAQQSAIIFAPNVLSGSNAKYLIVHELVLHAFAGLDDIAVYNNSTLIQSGLWHPAGDNATTYITDWIATDCQCTPGQPGGCTRRATW